MGLSCLGIFTTWGSSLPGDLHYLGTEITWGPKSPGDLPVLLVSDADLEGADHSDHDPADLNDVCVDRIHGRVCRLKADAAIFLFVVAL
ncbi:MAG: hypothetical protein ACI8QS_001125 [Planctomycetota bacterium]